MTTEQKHFPDDEIIRLMHDAGLRLSAHRMAIMSLVYNNTLHPSAEMVYQKLKPTYATLSRATVYNSLHALAEKGLLRMIDVGNGTMHYDSAASTAHAHFICRACGRIVDVPLSLTQRVMPEGYSVDAVEVSYKGICPDCNKKCNTKLIN